MARTKKTPATQTDGIAAFQAPFLAAPAGEHLALHFWQAQEGILKETEEFMTKWFKRRHNATRSALETCADAEAATSQNSASVAQAIATWQSHSMQRIAEDAQDCADMMSRCTALLLNNEAEAAGELMEDTVKSAGKAADAMPV
ncbi:hypothetical protein [Lentibacter sp. XHP0401]|uniref:hypothetical protein n=1 Tax=Lentibacter sp. XHP0401 TaxID=2984334 RepID=UPI0021E7121C|nr:hypothetical protein [Lentibacter sp. XHP0401]MCV2892084.1 hypothetical protein [Lentibacter sp. XHP0401]